MDAIPTSLFFECLDQCRKFHIAKQRAKENRDIIGMPGIQDENGNLKTEIGERLEVWRGYCERLINVEND